MEHHWKSDKSGRGHWIVVTLGHCYGTPLATSYNDNNDDDTGGDHNHTQQLSVSSEFLIGCWWTGCWKSVGRRRWQMKRCWYVPVKHRWLGHVLRHDNLLRDITEGKMLGKATWGRKRMELLHDMMEGRDYGQLKDLIIDMSRWRQDSKWECMSKICWKQQKREREKEPAVVSTATAMCACMCRVGCQYCYYYVCLYVSCRLSVLLLLCVLVCVM